jgi:hypothetical protein
VPYDTIFEPYAPLFADGLGDKIILFIPIATKSRFFSQSIGADIKRSGLHFLAKMCKNTMIEDLNDGYQ